MPFELVNKQSNNMEFNIGGRIGAVHIKSGDYFPTPEQEERGIYARDFTEQIGPSWLSKTPPATRRLLLEKAGLPVPESLIEVTKHLPQFKNGSAHADTPIPKVVVPSTTEFARSGPGEIEQQLQEMVDSKCSSSSVKKYKLKSPENP
jgi:hypothetical protein